ncbi:MAG: type II toxin-antitoxin system RelE/ParE family toxin [Gammaproteobacteria bacterium]|nr:type II toxin-antitoxin system RelE/ParE family toxin [Gammaproteobacteria bacterium]
MWEVEYTNEFEAWWNILSEEEQIYVAASVGLLEELGPKLGFPYSSKIRDSKYEHMRELRIQHGGAPYRVLYAFDPRRYAILLIGGNKKGDERWYKKFVPIADKLYQQHLIELKK